ncbi:MAG: FixH family protein [Chloroflexota bacterium]
MRQIVLLLCAAVLLAGCGGPAPQTAETDSYRVTLRLEGESIQERTATIEVFDRAGQPVTAERVVIAPVMRDMGMASPEVLAQPDGPGRYVARGEFFSMLGIWELDVRVTAGGFQETATFRVEVT